MLRAIPKGWFSPDYSIFENDQPVADIDLSFISESSEIQVKGATHQAYREHLMSGAFVLEAAGSIFARAEKPSALYRSFVVEASGRTFTLEAESSMLRKFVLLDAGKEVGSVYPDHAFTSKAVIDLPDDIPLPVRVFMFWLVAILWKRASDAAALSAV
jgi:hypothetical protein